MNAISVLGAGAFGTSLAIALARGGRQVTLVARSPDAAAALDRDRCNTARLPGAGFPDTLTVTAATSDLAPICLLAVPTQALRPFCAARAADLGARRLVACCKGVDLTTGLGPTGVIAQACPRATPAILSGPSFAADIAAGLPTALTIAAHDADVAEALQGALATTSLRLYRSTDVAGVELGGALKNVVAIAAGVAIGAGLGESARAALISRGYAELCRFAARMGAQQATLSGLSGLGDLILTSTSQKSRNFSHGLALGRGAEPDAGATVEGVATARAVAQKARDLRIDMPVTSTVAALVNHEITTTQAVTALLSRPLKEE